MATAKKKKPVKKKGEITPKGLKAFVKDLEGRSKERSKYVDAIMAVNDESVHEIIGWLVEALQAMHGEPTLFFKGATYSAIAGEPFLLEKIQLRNFKWIAVRVLVACAEWDIRIGDFKLPKKSCARCGVKVKPKVGKKARKKNG